MNHFIQKLGMSVMCIISYGVIRLLLAYKSDRNERFEQENSKAYHWASGLFEGASDIKTFMGKYVGFVVLLIVLFCIWFGYIKFK